MVKLSGNEALKALMVLLYQYSLKTLQSEE